MSYAQRPIELDESYPPPQYGDSDPCCTPKCMSTSAMIITTLVLTAVSVVALALAIVAYSDSRHLPCRDPGDMNGDGWVGGADCLSNSTLVADLALIEKAADNLVVFKATPSYAAWSATTNAAITLSATNNYISLGSTATEAFRVMTATGRVGFGTTTPHASSQVQIASTTRGFLPPVMTTTQKNAISSPTAGLVVYDSTLNKIAVYNGSAWRTVTDT